MHIHQDGLSKKPHFSEVKKIPELDVKNLCFLHIHGTIDKTYVQGEEFIVWDTGRFRKSSRRSWSF